jgi:diadenosine tetraphosphate (Ap4A) HIT family hydrolase
MRHPSFDSACGVCASLTDGAAAVVLENELWQVRHIGAPHGVPGWMMLLTRRHVGGPAHFDDREAASFGPTLRHLSRVLEEVTGALRVYMAAMGESFPHFHCHLVPRRATMAKDAKAWAVFDLQRAAAAGEVTVPEAEVTRVIEAYRNALARRPPPAP